MACLWQILAKFSWHCDVETKLRMLQKFFLIGRGRNQMQIKNFDHVSDLDEVWGLYRLKAWQVKDQNV